MPRRAVMPFSRSLAKYALPCSNGRLDGIARAVCHAAAEGLTGVLNDCHLGAFFIPPFLRSNQSLPNGEKEFAAHRPRPHLLHCSSIMLHASGLKDGRGG